MKGLSLAIVVVCAPAALARAQEGPVERSVSDDEVIRWASREIGRAEGRPVAERPPVPPDAYLGRGEDGGALHLLGAEDHLGLRLLAELGGGVVGILVGGGLGSLLVWGAAEADASPDVFALAVGAAAVLGALGVSAGVTLGGHLTGGRGNFGHAFLGQVIGAVAALPLVVLGASSGALSVSLVALGVLPLSGALVGYEIAHGDRAAGAGPVAFLTPTPRGALGGVAGALP